MHGRSRSTARYACSACAYAAFLAASLWGVAFLADVGPLPTVDSGPPDATSWAILLDLGLWSVFGLQHSIMARGPVKQRLTRVVPERVERSSYVLITSLALALLFWQWRTLPETVWHIDAQPWRTVCWVGYGAGWAVAVAATFMIDHWEFLGLRQAGWLSGAAAGASTSVTRRWLYGWVRHPMMLGLLAAFWVTPDMTAGHLLFALAASGYIAVGVHFEERDLRRQLGIAYTDYAQQVPRFVPVRASAPHALAGQGSRSR